MEEKPALLIIDMVKDYFKDENNYPITPLARKIIPSTNILIRQFRKHGFQPFCRSRDRHKFLRPDHCHGCPVP